MDTDQVAPVANRPEQEGRLLKVLGFSFAVAVGVGGVIGGGILRTPASVVDAAGGVEIGLLIWAAVAVHCLIQANSLAEVSAALPKAGGPFVPARAAFGEPGGLLIGWVDWLNLIASIAALSIITAEFLGELIPAVGAHPGIAGVLIALPVFLLNWLGVREGSAAQIVGSLAKVLFLLAIGALLFLSPAPSTAAVSATPPAPVALFGVVVAYQLVFGSYAGWTNPIYFAEEDTDPGRNIPRSLFATVLAVAVLYLLISTALSYALPLETLKTSKLPAAAAVGNVVGPYGLTAVAAGAVLIAASCLNATVMVAPRVLYGLAQQRLFPAWALVVNRGGTPSVALALTAIASIALTLSGEFETVFRVVATLGMFPLLVADLALFKLRRSAPDLYRPYRAKFYPVLPALAVFLDVAALIAFLLSDWTSGLFIIGAVGLAWPIGSWMRRSRSSLTA